MRILHVSEVDFGGVMTHLRLLLPRLQEKGVANRLLLPCPDSRSARVAVAELSRCGVEVRHLSMRRRTGPHNRAVAAMIRQAWKSGQVDLLHTHSTFAGLWGRLALPRGKRSLPSVHSPHAFALQRYPDPLRRRLAALLERCLLSRTDAYALLSPLEEGVARGLCRIPADRIAMIPNGIPAGMASAFLTRAEARQALTLPEHEPIVLFPGRLERQKGPELLLRALPCLRANPLVVFAETGSMELRLRRSLAAAGADDRARFAGGITDLWRYLRAFDAVALPSRYEGLPYSLLETLSAGVPAVTCDLGRPLLTPVLQREITSVPPEDPAALASALDRLLRRRGPLPQPRPLPPPYRCCDQLAALERLYAALIAASRHGSEEK